MRVRVLVGLALGAALAATGQTATSPPNARSLSLRECMDLALLRNLDLRIQHLALEIAGYDLGASYGVYSPVLSFLAQLAVLSQPGDFDPKKSRQDFP